MRQSTIEALVNAAMSVLHHDADEIDKDDRGASIAQWERQQLREKFLRIMAKKPSAQVVAEKARGKS